MRKILVLGLFLASVGYGSGKLTVQPAYNLSTEQWTPMIGLGVYEWIWKNNIAYNSWTGYGEQELSTKEDVHWFSTKHEVEFHLIPRMTIAPGYKAAYVMPYKEVQHFVTAKVAFKIW